MEEFAATLAAWSAALIESIGVAIIALFALFALLHALRQWLRGEAKLEVLHETRVFLGRGILLGLEFLIAADIIYTVAIELSFETVGVLAIIVLIRTFLSLALEVEINGKWPWRDG